MHTMILDQLVGQVIGKQDHYRIERLLGRSRLSVVYLARHLPDQKMVALTLFVTPEHFSHDAYQRFMQRFLTTAPTLTALHHPHILPVHEFGEQSGYPYLITPYLMHGSLADRLHQQQRFSYEEVGEVLMQIGPALQIAHNRGLVHGILKPANLVLDSQRQIMIAGFGLMHILQLSGIVPHQMPFGHLLSIAETLLVAPEYLAPEMIEGRTIDSRSDIYALGCILFELLSGTPPFTGNDPLAIVQMHTQQSVPSLQLLAPAVPLALVSVVHQALERDPQRRFQQVSDLLNAFSQSITSATRSQPVNRGIQRTSPASDQQDMLAQDTSKSWQLAPPIITGKIPAVFPTTSDQQNISTQEIPKSWQLAPPIITGKIPVVSPGEVLLSTRPPLEVSNGSMLVRQVFPPGTFEHLDTHKTNRAQPLEQQEPQRQKNSAIDKNRARVSHRGSLRLNRRQVLVVAASGGIVAASALLATNLRLFHLGEIGQQATNTTMQMAPQGTTAQTQSQQPLQKQVNTPQGKTTQGTIQPTHTGTVVGSTSLAINSARPFSNPADGKSSLLIHLPNGNFVAYKQACTHVGVSVHYDLATHTLICPAHGAIFDPMNHGAVLQGPAALPLPMVRIQVYSDGTITAI